MTADQVRDQIRDRERRSRRRQMIAKTVKTGDLVKMRRDRTALVHSVDRAKDPDTGEYYAYVRVLYCGKDAPKTSQRCSASHIVEIL